MKLHILGCCGGEAGCDSSPAYLVDGRLLLDAGTVGTVLSLEEQTGISHVLLSHVHFDHIKGLAGLVDNLALLGRQLVVAGNQVTLDALANHLFNGLVWPDFRCIPDSGRPALQFQYLEAGVPTMLAGYRITAVLVGHTVPTFGYVVQDTAATLVYTGDTGSGGEIWQHAAGADALLTEVAFPDDLEGLAHASRHLTPTLLARQLAELTPPPAKILLSHLKPAFQRQILAELAVAGSNIEILRQGMTLEIGRQP